MALKFVVTYDFLRRPRQNMTCLLHRGQSSVGHKKSQQSGSTQERECHTQRQTMANLSSVAAKVVVSIFVVAAFVGTSLRYNEVSLIQDGTPWSNA
jgi:hypothetical protein